MQAGGLVVGEDGFMLLPQTKLDRLLGDRTAKAFARHLGLVTVADLLQHYPRRYAVRGELTPIAQVPIGESVTVVAEIVDFKERRMSGKTSHLLEVRITDGSAFLTLTFFNQSWRQKDLRPGARGLFAGKIGAFNGRLQLAHPEYELFDAELDQAEAARWALQPIPIYPAASSVTTWAICRAMGVVLDTLQKVDDELPAEVVAAEKLISLDEALRKVHQPEVSADWQAARDTLRFHEAFLLQASLISRKAELAHIKADVREVAADGLLAQFDASLPFELTSGQRTVGNEILGDLASGHPMNRLLQGEVGSGKTLVALRAMLAVAESAGQSALIAPTEVLAAQHFASIKRTLGENLASKLGLMLLTGSMGAAERKRAMLQIVSGKAQLVVGTHALLADKVEFYDLAFVVIDEQHRFGVEQRETLRLKGRNAPHVLTMTATPIPRTLAVSVFGDLDISTLTELPAGRQAITSHVVQLSQPALIARTWSRVAEETAKGHQVFVVCPRISDSADEEQPPLELDAGDDIFADAAGGEGLVGGLDLNAAPKPVRPLAAVESTVDALRANPVLAGLTIEPMHGALASELKNETMQRFVAGEIQVLVSTTVIEVGVDVPNATLMVVLDADRFGVSQLHQLRGRVGRGGNAGLCLLMTAAESGSIALERVRAVADTLDGFKLSEIDLELRGEGDVLGANQSGARSSLRLLRVLRDADLIVRARELAAATLQADPTLEKHPILAETLSNLDDARQQNLAKG
jgi:ATP-dependent DNA helicase RecG